MESRDLQQKMPETESQLSGGKTLVFLMIANGTGKCQQTPGLNKDHPRSTFGFLCSASCLKLLFIAVQIGEKAFFFYMRGVIRLFFIFL